MVEKVGLRSFAGFMAWVANLCPQLSPFTRMLWAALSTRAEHEQVFLKQIQLPLNWILAFTKALNGPLVRFYRPRSETVTIISFDGSPSGGGATIQLAVPVRADRTKFPITFYWSTHWKHDDERLISAKIGAAASQAKWEAYSLLLAVMIWRPILKATESQLAFCGDALGVLIDAMKFRAREPILNKMMAELALVVAPFGFELTTIHTWSMHNETCDWLSRAKADERVPVQLQAAERSRDRRPLWAILEAPCDESDFEAHACQRHVSGT